MHKAESRPPLPRLSVRAIARIFFILGLAIPSLLHAEVKAVYARLPNGLKVILHRNPQAPVVACRLFYVTGSVHEAAGHTGIAHLLEHMLFKGTEKVGVKNPALDKGFEKKLGALMDRIDSMDPLDSAVIPLRARYDSLVNLQRTNLVNYELWEAYEKAGGTGLNAFTSDLMTAYIVTLPKDKLELYLWLESDRMQNAVLREFYSERDVIMEERRMRVEDHPLGRYWESLMGVFYEAHPYRIPTIGYPSDIRRLTKKQAEEHYKNFYKPNNAILVLAGDFDPNKTLQSIERYFGGIPRGQEFKPVTTTEPEPAGEKRLTVLRDDAKPRLDFLFHTPGFPNKDLYALDILEGALSGKAGRLEKKLVKESKLALSADAGNGVDKYESSFSISVSLDGKPNIDSVQNAVWSVLDDIRNSPLSVREIQRARNQVAARTIRSLENMEELATELAYWEMRGGWENINSFPTRVQEVDGETIRAVAEKYFRRESVTVGVVLPKEKPVKKVDLSIEKPKVQVPGKGVAK